MAEPTPSSAPLLPCPFCGDTPRFAGDGENWQDDDRYVQMEAVCCVRMSAALGWRSARDMLPAARESILKEKLAQEWNNRAPQAVAAQAPAAVATPDQIAFLNSDRDGWIEAHAKIYRAYQDLRNAADDLLTCVMHDGVLVDPEHPKRIAVEAVKASLCTTPALPATEDSSAGDLAEVHPDDAAVDALAAKMKAKLAKQRAKGYGGWDTPECSQQRLSAMLRDHVAKGDPVDVANFCAFLAARSEGIEAELQAEPVAERLDIDMHAEGRDPVEMLDRIFAIYQRSMGKPAPDAEMAQIVATTKEMIFSWWAEHRELIREALTAPQAQPADALDAETPYQRGYRHGYNQRDAEVQGALL